MARRGCPGLCGRSTPVGAERPVRRCSQSTRCAALDGTGARLVPDSAAVPVAVTLDDAGLPVVRSGFLDPSSRPQIVRTNLTFRFLRTVVASLSCSELEAWTVSTYLPSVRAVCA